VAAKQPLKQIASQLRLHYANISRVIKKAERIDIASFWKSNSSCLFQNTRVRIMRRQLTAIIEREGAGYVSLCPELDIASQGETVADARDNLREALELFF
jgi:hypothetical protein